jgi:hypothetical protein
MESRVEDLANLHASGQPQLLLADGEKPQYVRVRAPQVWLLPGQTRKRDFEAASEIVATVGPRSKHDHGG